MSGRTGTVVSLVVRGRERPREGRRVKGRGTERLALRHRSSLGAFVRVIRHRDATPNLVHVDYLSRVRSYGLLQGQVGRLSAINAAKVLLARVALGTWGGLKPNGLSLGIATLVMGVSWLAGGDPAGSSLAFFLAPGLKLLQVFEDGQLHRFVAAAPLSGRQVMKIRSEMQSIIDVKIAEKQVPMLTREELIGLVIKQNELTAEQLNEHVLALVALKVGDYALAAAICNRLARRHEPKIAGKKWIEWKQSGDAWMMAGNFIRAKEAYQSAIKSYRSLYPGVVNASLLTLSEAWADALYFSRKYEAASDAYEGVVRNISSEVREHDLLVLRLRVQQKLFQVQWVLGKHAEAKTTLEKLIGQLQRLANAPADDATMGDVADTVEREAALKALQPFRRLLVLFSRGRADHYQAIRAHTQARKAEVQALDLLGIPLPEDIATPENRHSSVDMLQDALRYYLTIQTPDSIQLEHMAGIAVQLSYLYGQHMGYRRYVIDAYLDIASLLYKRAGKQIWAQGVSSLKHAIQADNYSAYPISVAGEIATADQLMELARHEPGRRQVLHHNQ